MSSLSSSCSYLAGSFFSYFASNKLKLALNTVGIRQCLVRFSYRCLLFNIFMPGQASTFPFFENLQDKIFVLIGIVDQSLSSIVPCTHAKLAYWFFVVVLVWVSYFYIKVPYCGYNLLPLFRLLRVELLGHILGLFYTCYLYRLFISRVIAISLSEMDSYWVTLLAMFLFISIPEKNACKVEINCRLKILYRQHILQWLNGKDTLKASIK